jgi:hypothetical protein
MMSAANFYFSKNKLPIIEITLIHNKKLMDNGNEDVSALFRLKNSTWKQKNNCFNTTL